MKLVTAFVLALSALPMVAQAQLITDPVDPLRYSEDQYDRLVEQFEAFGELMALGASKPEAVQTAMDVNFGDYRRAMKVAEVQSLRRNISIYDNLYDDSGGEDREGGP